jgi:protein-S-isoprenylcysteine O-methyltransferase Ste14
MNDRQLSRRELLKLVLSRVVLFMPLLGALFFVPAGTLAYWEAWVYLGVLLMPMFLVLLYLLKRDPALLERRMRLRERVAEQKRIINLSYVVFIAAFVVPGLDRRFGWSHAPVGIVVAADVLVLLAYGLFVLVLRENSYASRVIEVAQGQQVISSGPYALVRHPMYLALGVLYVISPLALGSYWAMLPTPLIIAVLVARILNEEQVLARDLPGYAEYRLKTRYRLIPGVW